MAIIAVLPPELAAGAIMVSALGDAAAVIFGKMVGGPRLPMNRRKTVAGSLAMFLASSASCLVAGIPLVPSLITAVVATVTESLTRRSVDDELSVPIVAAVTLALLNYLGLKT